ncbi:spore germination protein [Paenibacillus aurantiacus]|uniref:Spore germination protein n=1 Tax=Paenibacillus aurantiacus TaxID=1936118 RepID=A0ABV5KU90_9BACL
MADATSGNSSPNAGSSQNGNSTGTGTASDSGQHAGKSENQGTSGGDGVSSASPLKPLTLTNLLGEFNNTMDLKFRDFPANGVKAVYLQYMIDSEQLYRSLVLPIGGVADDMADKLLQQAIFERADSLEDAVYAVLFGSAVIFSGDRAYKLDLTRSIGRSIEQTETETVIAGPHDGFVENIVENLALLRKRLRSSHLKTVPLAVGEVTKTQVVVAYIEGIANPDFVAKVTDRLQNIEFDSIYEANMLVQMIDDNPNSFFPQFVVTERPDAICSKLSAGRVVIFVDGSPSAVSAPASFFEFFTSPDDYYQRWHVGSALRLLRIVGFIITVGFTAFYVSVTTFHYEMIPHKMLLNLTKSRSNVPFPPLYEALLMETTIELLREAGARLPTKIGQTIGIVGGIVIGQAAVQAGFTSNVLIIAVASSAIASFVIPSYVMSASIRLIRFPLIFLAGVWGNFGLMIGIAFIVIHLSGITNLGSSYLTPIAPMNFRDWMDTFIRGPLYSLRYRPSQVKSPNQLKNKMRK